MVIKEFAQKIGMTEYGVRYYEKVGVLKPIKRQLNGYREFSETDLLWMQFVIKLKQTGMPIDQIKQYADLRELGETTKTQRQNLLESHEQKVKEQIESLQENLKLIQHKIDFYKSL